MFIDTHCHISSADYDDIDAVIKENLANNVDKMIVSACTFDTLEEAINLSKEYDCIYLTLGYHPSEAKLVGDEQLLFLKECLNNPKVVGIGEIGLDYHYGRDDRLEQITLFRKQLEIAVSLNLPVVIHSRDATFDTISILKEYPLKGVIHCFSGSLETAREYIKLGYKLGIGGVVTFTNSNLGDVVKEIGLSNIVLETDSPYLTPVPFRGKKNSSKYIPVIASKIADIFNISSLEVGKVTSNNASDMFDL